MISPVNLQRLGEISNRVTSRSHARGAEVTKVVNVLRDTDTHRQPVSWL